MAEELKKIISEYSGLSIDEITEDMSLKTATTLNSFQLISMLSEIEDMFNVEIKEHEIADLNTIMDLEKYLVKQR